jgi:hypothetical protein
MVIIMQLIFSIIGLIILLPAAAFVVTTNSQNGALNAGVFLLLIVDIVNIIVYKECSNMVGKIFGLLVSIGLIIGGASGAMVLRGTNSSQALVAAGIIFLLWDIYSIATHKKDSEEMKRLQEEADAAIVRKYAHAYPGKKKGWAIAWWLLGDFGFLGLHSFYLGRKKAGLLKLAGIFLSGVLIAIAARNIEKTVGDILIIPSSFGIMALLMWNIFDLATIIRLPKAAFEAEPPNPEPKEPPLADIGGNGSGEAGG